MAERYGVEIAGPDWLAWTLMFMAESRPHEDD
jgi:hypothetical protein